MNNYSKQRMIVLEAIKYLKHPTAEQIYDKVHQDNPSISRSTVYRNLNVLLENKTIKKIKALNGPDRFDYIDKEHFHIICNRCGKVFDFMYQFKQEELKKMIYNQTGVVTNVDSMTLYGICEECKTKINSEEN